MENHSHLWRRTAPRQVILKSVDRYDPGRVYPAYVNLVEREHRAGLVPAINILRMRRCLIMGPTHNIANSVQQTRRQPEFSNEKV
jgi:hypothetical protein